MLGGKTERTPVLTGNGCILKRGRKKAALIKWYRSEAAEILSERVAVFEEEMGVEAAAVKVSNATTRWGLMQQ